MDTKIQELTDKIYHEGVEKGKEEAARIISEANEQKQVILRNAEAEAKRIIAEADKQATALKKNTEAELKLFAAQFIESLKSEIANLITDRIASANISPLAGDKAFMQKLILEMTAQWAGNEGLTVQTADADALAAYFASNAKDLLNKKVKIERVAGKASSFVIVPESGAYKIAFGEEEFIAFFKEYLRPQLVDLLF
jgi:V/A-type H+-transporting ATPase subunit E